MRKWTVETVRKIKDEAYKMMGRSYEMDEAIADTHNAERKQLVDFLLEIRRLFPNNQWLTGKIDALVKE